MVRNGYIGKLKSINIWSLGSTPGGSTKVMDPPPTLDYDFWLGPAPFKPFTEDRCTHEGGKKTWWFNTDYALGFIAGWGIHPMDIALWGGADLLQGKVEVEGKALYGDTVACNTAKVWDIDFRFSTGVAMKFVGIPNGENAGKPTGDPYYHFEDWKKRYRRILDHGTAFEGDNGWVHVDRGGINLEPESLAEVKKEGFKTRLIQSGDHVGNFLACVKSRDKTVCPIEDAVLGDSMCHIADIAARLQRPLIYDIGSEDFINDREASGRLRLRDMRKPWHV